MELTCNLFMGVCVYLQTCSFQNTIFNLKEKLFAFKIRFIAFGV